MNRLLVTSATAMLASLAWMPASGVQYVEDRRTHEEWVEEFERAGLDRQLELATKLIALRDMQLVTRLERGLTEEDRHFRANTALLFAGLGDPRGLDVIAAILSDRSRRGRGQGVPGGKWSVAAQIDADRYYAVHVLSRLKDRRAVDLLIPLLADRRVSYKVAWALGEIRDPIAIQPLIRTLTDESALVRISAINALAKLEATEALPHLRALLSDRALPSAGDQISVGETARKAIAAIEKRR